MDGFAYWIFGYQKFAEPIIRECICMKKGWKDIFSKVQVPNNSELLEKLEKRTDWDNNFPLLKLNAVKEIGNRKRRMVLDGAFLDQSGSVIIGEFKSWGGFEKFDIDKLHHEVTSGILFPDRLAIDNIYYEQEPLEVSKFVIATNLSEEEPKDLIWEIGDLTVEVLDIAELLKEYGKSVAEKIGSFEQLEKSVASVKEYVNTGRTELIEAEALVNNEIRSINEEAKNMNVYENPHIKTFVDDDEGYLKWLEETPSGFVVNCDRTPNPDYLKLHRANCGTIIHATRGPGNWTTGDYIKVCSLKVAELNKWAEKEIGGQPEPCQKCKP